MSNLKAQAHFPVKPPQPPPAQPQSFPHLWVADTVAFPPLPSAKDPNFVKVLSVCPVLEDESLL
jgi:hypothetical protein